jgi:hypothetical protein
MSNPQVTETETSRCPFLFCRCPFFFVICHVLHTHMLVTTHYSLRSKIKYILAFEMYFQI